MSLLTNPEETTVQKILVAAAPLDAKMVVADIAARDAIPDIQRYHMMKVATQDTALEYRLANSGDLTNTGWVEVVVSGVPEAPIDGSQYARKDAAWEVALGSAPAGADTQVQFNDSGAFGAKVGFQYDAAKDMLIAGAGSLVPDFTGAHAEAGSWSGIFGEDHTFGAGARAVNMLVAGWHHTLGDFANFGLHSASSGVAVGVDHDLFGQYSTAFGFGARTEGLGSFAIGNAPFIGGGLANTQKKVTAAGVGAINISSNTNAQTDKDVTPHGARAPYSAILGGIDHIIPVDSDKSIIIGGDAIVADAATENTVFMPKLRIGRGTAGETAQDDALTKILVQDGTTGEVKWRDVSTIGGGGGSPGGVDQQVQFNDGGVFNGDDALVFDKTSNTLFVGVDGVSSATLRVNGISGIAAYLDGIGAIKIPAGNVGQRPAVEEALIRYNTDDHQFEGTHGASPAFEPLGWGRTGTTNVVSPSIVLAPETGGNSIGISGGNFTISAGIFLTNTSTVGAATIRMGGLNAGFDAFGLTFDGYNADGNGVMVWSQEGTDAHGIEYAGDYSATFADHSLVTKKWVEDNAGGGGWPLTGSASLTGNVFIDGAFNVSFGDDASNNLNDWLMQMDGIFTIAGAASVNLGGGGSDFNINNFPTFNINGDSGTLGEFLGIGASGGIEWLTPAGGGSPAGADTQIQFNDSGAFGASSSFRWTEGSNTITLGVNATKQVQYSDIGVQTWEGNAVRSFFGTIGGIGWAEMQDASNDKLIEINGDGNIIVGLDESTRIITQPNQIELYNSSDLVVLRIAEGDADNSIEDFGTTSWKIPNGTTGERPATPAVAQIRYNSTLSTFEGYNGGWLDLASATPAGTAEGAIQLRNSAGTALNADDSFKWTANLLTVSNGDILVTGNRDLQFTDGGFPKAELGGSTNHLKLYPGGTNTPDIQLRPFSTSNYMRHPLAIGPGAFGPAVDCILDLSLATNSMYTPRGTTAQRPTPVAGMFRYNTDTSKLEIYTTTWETITSV